MSRATETRQAICRFFRQPAATLQRFADFLFNCNAISSDILDRQHLHTSRNGLLNITPKLRWYMYISTSACRVSMFSCFRVTFDAGRRAYRSQETRPSGISWLGSCTIYTTAHQVSPKMTIVIYNEPE